MKGIIPERMSEVISCTRRHHFVQDLDILSVLDQHVAKCANSVEYDEIAQTSNSQALPALAVDPKQTAETELSNSERQGGLSAKGQMKGADKCTPNESWKMTILVPERRPSPCRQGGGRGKGQS